MARFQVNGIGAAASRRQKIFLTDDDQQGNYLN